MRNYILFIFLACTVLFGQAPNPNEWPIIYNVNNTGFSATTVLKPPLKVRWMARVPGAFKAGPVLAESCVVVQSRDGYVICLNANTGQINWRYFVQATGAFGFGFLETGPCIWNGRAYAAFYSAGSPEITGMRCFDLKTGRVLWKKDVGYTEHRIHFSPQVTHGRLFFCSNREVNGYKITGAFDRTKVRHVAQVQAWDAVTGDTLWTHNMWDSACNNTTLLSGGDTVFASVGLALGSTLGRTMAFDLDGNVLWQSDSFHVAGHCGNLQYLPGKLIMLRGSGSSSATAVTILNTQDWSVVLNNGGGDLYSKIVPVMNGKYYSRGYAQFAQPYSLATGVSTPFTHSLAGYGAQSGCSAPTCANGYVYNCFGNTDTAQVHMNAGHQVVATDESGNVVWAYHDQANHCPSAAIAYDRMYIAGGAEGVIYCFENTQ